MKMECQQAVLQKALQHVVSVTEKRTTSPMTANVLLDARNGQLHICGTDNEVTVQSSCPAQVSHEGKVCTPASHLLEIVRRLPKPEVVLYRDESAWLIIHSGQSQFRVATADAHEFPTLPQSSQFRFKPISTSALSEGFDKTWFAMGTDTARPHMMGILLQIENEESPTLYFIGSDTHRLSLFKYLFQKDDGSFAPQKLTLPRKGVMEIRKLLSETNQNTAQLGIHDGLAAFVIDETMISMKLLVGTFPDFRKFLPKGDRKLLMVKTQELSEAIKRVSLLSDSKTRLVHLEVSTSSVRLMAKSPELGEAEEHIGGEFEGDILHIGFNAKYILDAISSVSSEKVLLELGDTNTAGILRTPDDNAYLGVIMPMRI